MTSETTETTQDLQPSVLNSAEFFRTLGRLEERDVRTKEQLAYIERNVSEEQHVLDRLDEEQAQTEEQIARLIRYAKQWHPYSFDIHYTLGWLEEGQKCAKERIARLKQRTR